MRSRFSRHLAAVSLALGTAGALASAIGLPLGASAACACEGGGGGGGESLVASPTTLAFGGIKVKTTARKLESFVNSSGTEALEITGTRFSGTDMEIVPKTNKCVFGVKLGPGGSCSIEIEFFPQTENSFTGEVEAKYEQAGANHHVIANITGTGTK